MGDKLRVGKCGPSLAVHIPEAVAQAWGVREGSLVELDSSGDETVLRKKQYDLADLIAQITPENRHPEMDWGPPQGEEVW